MFCVRDAIRSHSFEHRRDLHWDVLFGGVLGYVGGGGEG